ncbi:MAG: MetQ/NlpA family ABC transporter substrate-binding protein [Bacillus subtilis]|nr:MetQ/NlpA family ABC transporter substrate-binding protein [Bacillus subtilis]
MKKLILVLLVVFLGVGLSACANRADINDKTITIGATPVPHAEILAIVKTLLEAQGYVLEVVEFTDYVLPNTALADGELRCQFLPAFTVFNELQRQSSNESCFRGGDPF